MLFLGKAIHKKEKKKKWGETRDWFSVIDDKYGPAWTNVSLYGKKRRTRFSTSNRRQLAEMNQFMFIYSLACVRHVRQSLGVSSHHPVLWSWLALLLFFFPEERKKSLEEWDELLQCWWRWIVAISWGVHERLFFLRHVALWPEEQYLVTVASCISCLFILLYFYLSEKHKQTAAGVFVLFCLVAFYFYSKGAGIVDRIFWFKDRKKESGLFFLTKIDESPLVRTGLVRPCFHFSFLLSSWVYSYMYFFVRWFVRPLMACAMRRWEWCPLVIFPSLLTPSSHFCGDVLVTRASRSVEHVGRAVHSIGI